MAMSPITKTIMILEEFRKVNPEFPMPAAVVFMRIAQKPGISYNEIAKDTGLGKASISRYVTGWSTDLGSGLVEARPDIADRRNMVVKLTPQGERVVRSITAYLGE